MSSKKKKTNKKKKSNKNLKKKNLNNKQNKKLSQNNTNQKNNVLGNQNLNSVVEEKDTAKNNIESILDTEENKTENKTKNKTKQNKKKSKEKEKVEGNQIKQDNEKEKINQNKIKQDNEKNKTNKNQAKQNNETNKLKQEKVKKEKNKGKNKVTEEDVSKEKEEIENTKEEVSEIKNKRKIYIFICIAITIIFILLFSTCFALLNFNNSKFVKGVTIKNLDISNLTIEEAKYKIEEIVGKELLAEIQLTYGDQYKATLKPEQIEFKYEIDKTLEEAYKVGRNDNILISNYSILFTTLFGKNIELEYTYNEELLNNFIDDIASKIPGVVVNPAYYIEESKLFINPGTDGIQVKKEELKKDILEKISTRKIEEVLAEGYNQIIEIPTEQVKSEKIDMEKIYSEIHTEPKDAYFETEPYKIYPDVDGVDLVISVEEAQKIIDSEKKDEYSFDLNITKAEKTIDDLGFEAFPYLISEFSTNYIASNVNRTTNLKIAAGKINGKVIMPGEEFSFNQVVGKRTVEEGYKDAQIYADGGVVDGLAGGICQISSTLYDAVLLANLQVTERRNHSYTTSYLEAGKDATVVWGTIDFKFVNSRSYPIKIEASVDKGVATFKIHGIQEDPEYKVQITSVKTQSIPYSTSYVQDPTLAPGQQVVTQAGHPGYKVTTYKELILDGNVVSKEAISNDTYNPMRAIIRIGPSV